MNLRMESFLHRLPKVDFMVILAHSIDFRLDPQEVTMVIQPSLVMLVGEFLGISMVS